MVLFSTKAEVPAGELVRDAATIGSATTGRNISPPAMLIFRPKWHAGRRQALPHFGNRALPFLGETILLRSTRKLIVLSVHRE